VGVRPHKWKEAAQLIEFNKDLICSVAIKTWDVSSNKVLACDAQTKHLI